MKNKKQEVIYSDFWLNANSDDLFCKSDQKENFIDLISLSSYKKVISNFVSILTGKNIPVKFHSQKSRSTEDTVWISASIKKKKDFDWIVGVALHEASHILLSDFKLFRQIHENIPDNLKLTAFRKGISLQKLNNLCRWVYNFIEDRYIDNFVFNEAVGYRGYYKALYEKFWNSSSISKVLKSDKYRVPNLDSYEFRVINLTNPNTDLKALPGLEKIFNIINMPNIGRLDTPLKRFQTALNVIHVIINNIEIDDTNDKNSSNSNINSNIVGKISGYSKKSDNEKFNEDLDTFSNKNLDDNSSNNNDDVKDGVSDKNSSNNDDVKDGVSDKNSSNNNDVKDGVSDKTLKKAQSDFEKIKKFLSHDFKKSSITKNEELIINIIDTCGIEMIRLNSLKKEEEGSSYNFPPIDCVFVKKLTKELINDPENTFALKARVLTYKEAVENGFKLGIKLGKKLQIRREIQIEKSIRRLSGKIEKRLLANIGAGLEDIFNKTKISKYNKAKIHISVDSSGSMSCNEKWLSALTCVTAICVACSFSDNIDISVTFRSSISAGSQCYPYIILAYDSTVDKISKIKELFPYLKPNGLTPEGLAFEAIAKYCIFPKKQSNEDFYFLNISDGEPYFTYSSYTGTRIVYNTELACEHTRKQVNNFRRNGITILSYFIFPNKENNDSKRVEELMEQFKIMYGKDAKFIDVNDVIDISKTINQMFLKKDTF